MVVIPWFFIEDFGVIGHQIEEERVANFELTVLGNVDGLSLETAVLNFVLVEVIRALNQSVSQGEDLIFREFQPLHVFSPLKLALKVD